MEQVRITIDPNVHFGKPCVKGTRIPVYAVLELLEDGATFDDILRDYYPDITRGDIEAFSSHFDRATYRRSQGTGK